MNGIDKVCRRKVEKTEDQQPEANEKTTQGACNSNVEQSVCSRYSLPDFYDSPHGAEAEKEREGGKGYVVGECCPDTMVERCKKMSEFVDA